MDFWDLIKLLAKRWYFSLPLLALSVAGTVLVGMGTQPDYKATSYVSLVPPVSPTVEHRVRNPWLESGIGALAKAAIFSVGGERLTQELKAQGLSDTFTIEVQGYEPIVTVEVVGATEQQASATTNEIVRRLESSVLTLQQDYGTTSVDTVTTRRLDRGNVEVSTSKVKRLVVVVGAVGLLITASFTIGLDAAIRRRALRRTRVDLYLGPGPPSWRPSPEGRLNGHGAPDPARAPALPAGPVLLTQGETGQFLNGASHPPTPMTVDYRVVASSASSDMGRIANDSGEREPDSEGGDATIVLPLTHIMRRPSDHDTGN